MTAIWWTFAPAGLSWYLVLLLRRDASQDDAGTLLPPNRRYPLAY